MKFNIFIPNYKGGHYTDRITLTEELERLGHEVFWALDAGNIPQADINIHLEDVYSLYVGTAKRNWLLVNPEWFTQNLNELDYIDLFLCKTKEAEKNLSHLSLPTFYLGFTSPDCFKPEVEKDFNLLYHYQGGTYQRGTFWIERTWSGDKEHTLPHLIILRRSGLRNAVAYERGSVQVITDWIEDDDYNILKNKRGIHLSPSSTEGFGHSINEAMSACSIVVTIDAPPMNELITDPECLIPVKNPFLLPKLLNLGKLYDYDPRDMIKTVKKLTSLPREKLMEMGQKNRQTYLNNRDAFRQRLKQLLKEQFPEVQQDETEKKI